MVLIIVDLHIPPIDRIFRALQWARLCPLIFALRVRGSSRPRRGVSRSLFSLAEQAGFPKMSDIEHWRRELHKFLHGEDMVLKIPYPGPDLNPRHFWHTLASRNPLRFGWQAFTVALTTYMPAGALKNALLRSIGMRVGREAFIASGVFFDVEFPTLIEVGDGAIIGTKTQILTHDVTIRTVRVGRVKIGRQAVIGAKCLIRSGVRIGDGAVVAMQSFVNRDVQDRELCGGSPVQTIRMLDDLI